MGAKTQIEWADGTWYPWMGCAKISEGCQHCYAAEHDRRFHAGKHWGANGRELQRPEYWAKLDAWNANPLKLTGGENRRPLIFPSMIDPLDDSVPGHWLALFFDRIRRTPNLVWLILTKRPQDFWVRIETAKIAASLWDDDSLFNWLYAWTDEDQPPANVWMGVSAENQQRADERIQALLNIPAVLRFVSCEPLLGPVDLTRAPGVTSGVIGPGLFSGSAQAGIDWVIAGGESGPHARPMHPDWVRSLRDQCARAEEPFMFKQWGEWAPNKFLKLLAYQRPFVEGRRIHCWADGSASNRIGKKHSGNLLDGVQHLEFPALRNQPLVEEVEA